MTTLNWAHIASGATFEELVRTLVWFEDPEATLFGRRGKDGGQDVRSGDGQTVYQAKYHQDGSAAAAIRDAKKEADQIKKYQAPQHSRHAQWVGVKTWVLVTNAQFNPTDDQLWKDEVVPQFQALGLQALYWPRSNLEGLLAKHPEVKRAYFDGHPRVFLSIPEAEETLAAKSWMEVANTFVGRDDELQQILKSLASDPKKFYVLHGPGGIGKTRLLLELGKQAAEDGFQVFWALEKTMLADGQWFLAVVPERRTLLLLDEPDDPQLLQRLAEQAHTRMRAWTVLVTVRSPKDPVLKYLGHREIKGQVERFAIDEPKNPEDICKSLFQSSSLKDQDSQWQDQAAKQLAKSFHGYPIWLKMATWLLEKNGDLAQLAETTEDLAQDYLDEIIKRQSTYPPNDLENLLRWVALFSPVNGETDLEFIAQLAKKPTENVEAQLADLIRRRALFRRGARDRWLEIKPDVLRDHILRRWLTFPGLDGQKPTTEAQNLAKFAAQTFLAGEIERVDVVQVTNFARLDFYSQLEGEPIPLFQAFFTAVKAGLTSETKPSVRIMLVEAWANFAPFQSAATVQLCQYLRELPAKSEQVPGLLRTRTVDHDDVVLSLAWTVFAAAQGAGEDVRRQVLVELCTLVELEATIGARLPRSLPNDGKRAKDLLRKVVEGGPQFLADYDDVAAKIACELLDQAEDPAKQIPAEILVDTLTSLERRLTWAEADSITWQMVPVGPGHPGWAPRRQVLNHLRTLISSDSSSPSARLFGWKLFADAHAETNRAWRGERNHTLRSEVLDNLAWSNEILSARKDDAIDEFRVARPLWSWSIEFEQDAEIKNAAGALEALYRKNALAQEFGVLFNFRDVHQHDELTTQIAQKFAAAINAQDIEDFISRAITFLGKESEAQRLSQVFWQIGIEADNNPAIQDFITTHLAASPPGGVRVSLALAAAGGWVYHRRQKGSDVVGLIHALEAKCGGEEAQLALLVDLFSRGWVSVQKFKAPEYDLIRERNTLFWKHSRHAEFVGCIAWGFGHRWSALSQLLEKTFDDATPGSLETCVGTLLDTISMVLPRVEPQTLPPALTTWVLNQIIKLPEMDKLVEYDWRLHEIINKTGRVPLAWLVTALQFRSQKEQELGYDNFRAVGHQFKLTSFIAPTTRQQLISAVHSLLNFVDSDGTVVYFLREILRDLDPIGDIVGPEVATKIANVQTEPALVRLAYISGVYEYDSAGWRAIAQAALTKESITERNKLYAAFVRADNRVSALRPGEVPPHIRAATETAKRQLEAESDGALKDFWRWLYQQAQEAEKAAEKWVSEVFEEES